MNKTFLRHAMQRYDFLKVCYIHSKFVIAINKTQLSKHFLSSKWLTWLKWASNYIWLYQELRLKLLLHKIKWHMFQTFNCIHSLDRKNPKTKNPSLSSTLYLASYCFLLNSNYPNLLFIQTKYPFISPTWFG